MRITIYQFLTFCSLSTLSCISCQNKEGTFQRRKENNHIVEGKFWHDTIPNGVINYYDEYGKIFEKSTFSYGVRNGWALRFYRNGVVRDSVYYLDGLVHGQVFGFYDNHNIAYIKNYYHGLSVGDHCYFDSSGRIKSYFFSDFDRRPRFNCEYDSVGSIANVESNNLPFFENVMRADRDSALNIFLYFPRPYGIKTVYKLGLNNGDKMDTTLAVLGNNQGFLDTLVGYPPKGWHYYVSTEIGSENGSINKVLIQDLKEK